MASTDVAVIGAGPGGYPAAFLAADLGKQVTLIDPEPNPGGVCLYRGCIPSKALLHIAKLIHEAKQAAAWGVTFSEPKIDLDALRSFKNGVVQKLTGGTGTLGKARGVTYLQGTAAFLDAHTLRVEKADGSTENVTFEHAIIATGSRPAGVPGIDIQSPRVWDSTGALALEEIPASLLIVGGGYIGLEMGSVYAALGSKVTVVEFLKTLLPGADKDLAKILQKAMEEQLDRIMLETKVTAMTDTGSAVRVTLEGKDGVTQEESFDRVLVAVGRRPNSAGLGLENTKVVVNQRGFIEVDAQRRTAEPTIFAIGDVAGDPMLAHKATHEGRLAAEVIAGKTYDFSPHAIPAVVFTDPEVAWCGLTETEAKAQGRKVKTVRFPWSASGRATTMDRNDGTTKLIVDPDTEQVLGVGIVGAGAGELIAEGVLAIEMAAVVSDLSLSIHPHPTLSETVMEAADVFFGHSTHMVTRRL